MLARLERDGSAVALRSAPRSAALTLGWALRHDVEPEAATRPARRSRAAGRRRRARRARARREACRRTRAYGRSRRSHAKAGSSAARRSPGWLATRTRRSPLRPPPRSKFSRAPTPRRSRSTSSGRCALPSATRRSTNAMRAGRGAKRLDMLRALALADGPVPKADAAFHLLAREQRSGGRDELARDAARTAARARAGRRRLGTLCDLRRNDARPAQGARRVRRRAGGASGVPARRLRARPRRDRRGRDLAGPDDRLAFGECPKRTRCALACAARSHLAHDALRLASRERPTQTEGGLRPRRRAPSSNARSRSIRSTKSPSPWRST